MTKSDLIQRISKDTGLSMNQTSKVVNDVFSVITDSLEKGEDVRVTGFGTFRVAHTSERMGRNPRTGEPMRIPAGKRPAFSAGSGLVEAVRGGGPGKQQAA